MKITLTTSDKKVIHIVTMVHGIIHSVYETMNTIGGGSGYVYNVKFNSSWNLSNVLFRIKKYQEESEYKKLIDKMNKNYHTAELRVIELRESNKSDREIIYDLIKEIEELKRKLDHSESAIATFTGMGPSY